MAFAGINYLAVLIAAAASFAFGAVWYGVFAKPWMAAAGVTEADRNTDKSIYLVAAVCQLVMAVLLAGAIGHLERIDIPGAPITAAFLWLGFVLTTMTVNHRFQGKGWNLTVIDGGYWLVAMLIQGTIIGAMGV
jgi:uncharacterized protein DUF1761